LLVMAAACATPEVTSRPDVVLITIDTLRYDHVGANNPHSPAATPHFDRLARDGVRFSSAWSPISVTGPAFASALTGKTPTRHGVLMNLFKGGAPLDAVHQTLAEQLKAIGYRTGAFVSGFTLRQDVGLDQGFDVYDAPKKRYRRWSQKTVRRAIRWLSESDQPAFLWLHSYDPHGPLEAWTLPDETTREWERAPTSAIARHQRIDDIVDPAYYRAKYALSVEYADAAVGQLMTALDDGGRYDNALILFTADHGEGFDERDVWFEHGSNAYPEQLHIPMVLKRPNEPASGSTHHALVSLIDIVPTVRRVLGLPPLADVDGGPLLTVVRDGLDGESSHCKPIPFVDCGPIGGAGKVLVTRTATDTLMRRSTKAGAVYAHYSRTTDPGERTPTASISTAHTDPVPHLAPENVRTPLEALRRQRAAATYAALPDAASEGDSTEIENLRALGYVE
jgi:arylsulfatase A-like enzyme